MSSDPPISADSSLARLLRERRPGSPFCMRCGYPHPIRPLHAVPFQIIETAEGLQTSGCGPLCEVCWGNLGTWDQRWPFFLVLLDWWKTVGRLPDPDDQINLYLAVRDDVQDPLVLAQKMGIELNPIRKEYP